jgi:hypothetical protein
LQDGPRRFRPGFTCPTLLGYRIGGLHQSLRDYHPLWCHFPKDFGSTRSIPWLRPHNPGRCPARFGLVPVRSPLLRESRLISFPPGTEMFQFPGLLGYSRLDARWAAPPDFSQPSTPDLLMTPRHPPRALRSLTTPIGPPLLRWLQTSRNHQTLRSINGSFSPRPWKIQPSVSRRGDWLRASHVIRKGSFDTARATSRRAKPFVTVL